jgi:TonB family protein
MPLERAYMATVERIIKEHSLVPDTPEYRSALLKGQETLVSFELDRNGRVGQVFVDRPSGSIALDKLAARIVSSGFYPPFPEGAWPDQAHHLFTTEIMFR